MPWLAENSADLVLLDLMLPGTSGIDVCRLIRQQGQLPVIMVTARSEEIDRLLGLELGADDYICKPFSPREVVARVRAVLRRTVNTGGGGDGSGEKNQKARLKIDPERHHARLDGVELRLTPVEFSLLHSLSSHPGRVFSRDQLMNEMYADYRVVTDRAVDAHIKNLRRKLEAAAPGLDLIESIYGIGYRARSGRL
jgi:two-component system response regulator BaeR